MAIDTSTDLTGATTGTLDFSGGATSGITTFTGSSVEYIDYASFIREWKKFRSEFLPIILKDSDSPITHFTMKREMNPKTKEIIVHLQISYRPEPEPKKGVRRTV